MECCLCLCAVHQQLHYSEERSEGAVRSGWLLRCGGPALPTGGDRHSAAYATDVPAGTGYSAPLYGLNEPRFRFLSVSELRWRGKIFIPGKDLVCPDYIASQMQCAKKIQHPCFNFPFSSRDTLLGSYSAQLPRVQEEAVEDDRPCSGLRCGRLTHPVQRGQRDGPEGDLRDRRWTRT